MKEEREQPGPGRRRRSGTQGDGRAPTWPPGFATGKAGRDALLVLLGLASLTPRRLIELAQDHDTAEACLEAVARGRAGSELDRAHAARADPAEIGRRLRAAHARLATVHDRAYPPGLLELFDPPAGLFVRGNAPREAGLCVAVVGARNCSPAGREIARLLGRSLAMAGMTVVSGGARGIDAAAHQGALDADGPTIAVLGCGIDVAYPSANRPLFDRMIRRGSVVSEYPPGVRAEPFRFPARNRIVAALSRAVVVVEGAEGSGSMITADHALDLGRDVFAVPGPVTSGLAAVPLALIRDGATLIRGPDDLLADLGTFGPNDLGAGTSDRAGREAAGARDAILAAASDKERRVWQALDGAAAPDVLAEQAGLSVPEVMSALVGLELRRLVLRTGGRYERRPG